MLIVSLDTNGRIWWFQITVMKVRMSCLQISQSGSAGGGGEDMDGSGVYKR